MVLRWGSVLFLVVMLAACGGGGGDVTSDSSSGNVSAGASGEGSEFDDVGLASRTAQSELYQEFDDLLFPVNYFEIDVLNPNRIVRKADSEEIVLPTDQPIEVGLRTFGYLPDETRFVVAEADRIVLNGQNDLRLSPIKGFEGRYKLEKQGGREQLAIYLKSTVPPHKKTPAILPGSDEIVRTRLQRKE